MIRNIPFLAVLTGLWCLWSAALAGAEKPVLRCDFGPPPLAEFDDAMAGIRAENGIVEPELTDGEMVAVRFPRTVARPQDRWLDGVIEFGGDPLRTRLEIALFGLGETLPAAELELRPEGRKGRLEVDLRSAKLSKGRVVVRAFLDGKLTGSAETFVSAAVASRVPEGTQIPIQLDIPNQVNGSLPQALSFGVPFAPGALWEAANLRLLDKAGRELLNQKEITARWAREGSIQWVRFDTVAVPENGIFVEVATEVGEAKPGLTVVEADGQLVVDTGTADYRLRRGTSPIAQIEIEGNRVATDQGVKGLYITNQDGVVASAAAEGETMDIESRGPVSACIRFEGDYRTAEGKRMARHITRLEFSAGQPDVQIQHTLVLTEDSNEVWFTDIGWELALPAGTSKGASFATSRLDPTQFVSAAPGSSWMIQDSHFQFKHGRNHYSVNGPAGPIHEGEECGDWFTVLGENGGLGWACRDAARQHPKEFEAHPDRLTLHLWSSRSGENLDFKMSSLVERWDLAGWLEKLAIKRDVPRIPELIKQAEAIEHNAVGWAKTHELLLRPLAAKDGPVTMAAASANHSYPVLALVDPDWLYQSHALGALYPRDTKNFPGVEATVDGATAWWHQRIHQWGEYGFVDYYAGPHLTYKDDYPSFKRYHWATYGLRPGLWMLYARSGHRDIYELASKNNQSFMDNHFAHWDGPGKQRGFYLGNSVGGDHLATPATLPLYWEGRTSGNISSSTDLAQMLRDYYLTGNRRARDVVKQYGEAAKRNWSPQEIVGSWRSLMDYRCLAQCYSLDWDPELGAMAQASLEIFRDRESSIGLTKNRPYKASTYKTHADIGGLLDGREILGTPLAHDVAKDVSQFLAPTQFASTPLGYNNPSGRVGHFLYSESGDASIAEAMGMQLRWLSSQWDQENQKFRGDISAAGMLFLAQGVPYAQDVVTRARNFTTPAASWIGAESVGDQLSFIVRKPVHSKVSLWLRRPRDDSPGDAGGKVTLTALDAPNAWGLDLNRVESDSNLNTRIELPKDAPEAAYEISASGDGGQLLRADSRVPLVLHAPGYWQPDPPQDPPSRWYFQVPTGAEGGAIYFEGAASLYDPSGKLYINTEGKRGWVSIPESLPGLWSFTLLEPKLLRVRNLPPFFARQDPQSYFEPPVPWEREADTQTELPDPAEIYVSGALTAENNQALQLSGNRRLMIEGNGALPFKEGTIEFWYRPNYDTLNLTEGGAMITLDTEKGKSWALGIRQGVAGGNQWYLNRSLLGSFETDGASKLRTTRCYRQTLFESGQWVHVAWTWGARTDLVARGSGVVLKAAAEHGILTQRIYINGKAGKYTPDSLPGNFPRFAPTRFRTGSSFDGSIDELRLSKVMRYLDDFTPPSRKRALEADEDTLALFHFDGDTLAESIGDGVTVTLDK
ncbi:MAG: hypothetical protein P1U89_04475 [Verrucomicrobiales bacterium]|nr:hypothetical protein [Verrucomicrobiales bacterium]